MPGVLSDRARHGLTALAVGLIAAGMWLLVSGAMRLAPALGVPTLLLSVGVLACGIGLLGGFAVLVAPFFGDGRGGIAPQVLVLGALAAGGLWMVVFAVAAVVMPWDHAPGSSHAVSSEAVAHLLRGVGEAVAAVRSEEGRDALVAIAVLGLAAASATTLAVLGVATMLWRAEPIRLLVLGVPSVSLVLFWVLLAAGATDLSVALPRLGW